MSNEAPQQNSTANQWPGLAEKPQYDPTTRWKNLSTERVGFNRARIEAEIEDEHRTKAKNLGEMAAQAALDTEHPLSSLGAQINYEDGMRVVQDGAKAAEAAGQAYDALPHEGVSLEKHAA